jgi:hypothetical protein
MPACNSEFLNSQASQKTILTFGSHERNCGMAHTKETGGRKSPMAVRLRLIRLAEGETNSSRWAHRMGWTQPALSNYENGVMISRDAAIRMANRVPGLTTDYILRGIVDGLSVSLRRRLEEAEAVERAEEA